MVDSELRSTRGQVWIRAGLSARDVVLKMIPFVSKFKHKSGSCDRSCCILERFWNFSEKLGLLNFCL